MEGYARIGDTCLVGDGTHSKIERHDFGVLYLTSRNFKDGRLDLSKVYYISERDYAKHFLGEGKALILPKANDLVFSIIGTIGEPYLVRQTDRFGVSSSVAIIRPNRELINPTFLLHWFKGPVFQYALFGIKGGVAQGYVSLEMIRSLPAPKLPLAMQRRIAGILSAYDELIENNQRRIRILEDMARSLYREWFVHFRYPGHESAPLTDSSLGQIPQGWGVKTVTDSFEIVGGGTPSRKEPEYWDDGIIQWFAPSNLTGAGTMFMDDSCEHISERGLAKSSARLFPARSVMLTSRATIGAIAINTHEACTNQGFITCLPNERVPLYFLFYWLKENVPTFQRMASGATFKEISRGVFKTIEFIQPPFVLASRFEATVGPIAEQMHTLQRQTANLRRTRDLLLPRLLSGQVELADLPDEVLP
ncbi:hypothetical protein SCT_2718 [Sulfuricella sp. T08]|uniref:restriction endonuclease subunit S n=1 Tax=Sulfuricella sp. T08 TaxID=1632857 RepID=UPI0006179C78|nr:restriction endonuclease subunit S [Sulfuricella sp. T08]GAO37298.1 hypothetical protein SCT_2718 [Sulfuricella sp. T08]